MRVGAEGGRHAHPHQAQRRLLVVGVVEVAQVVAAGLVVRRPGAGAAEGRGDVAAQGEPAAGEENRLCRQDLGPRRRRPAECQDDGQPRRCGTKQLQKAHGASDYSRPWRGRRPRHRLRPRQAMDDDQGAVDEGAQRGVGVGRHQRQRLPGGGAGDPSPGHPDPAAAVETHQETRDRVRSPQRMHPTGAAAAAATGPGGPRRSAAPVVQAS